MVRQIKVFGRQEGRMSIGWAHNLYWTLILLFILIYRLIFELYIAYTQAEVWEMDEMLNVIGRKVSLVLFISHKDEKDLIFFSLFL